jgi:hypothetical protein
VRDSVWLALPAKIRAATKKAFVTAWKRRAIDYFFAVSESRVWDDPSGPLRSALSRPIQKWTRRHGSIDAQAKKYDQWPREGIILL